jgi:DNA-binding response OmpR family regulator
VTGVCSECGHELTPVDTVVHDGWAISPSGAVSYNDVRALLTGGEAKLLSELASAKGKLVSAERLRLRCSESFDIKTIHVRVCKLRQHLRAQRLPDPIETVHGQWGTSVSGGYRWRSTPGINPALIADLRPDAPEFHTPVHGALHA